MRRALLSLLALLGAGIGWSGQAHAQGIQVSPVVIDVPTARGVTSFRLRNARNAAVSFEVEAYAWTQENGESVLTPTTDIVIAPSVFLIDPSREQIVRLAVSAAARASTVERTYRVLVRELPSSEAHQGFRLQLEMSMPVFVRPANTRGELHVRRVQGADGAGLVRVTNSGTAHLNLSDVPGVPALENMPRYILPGASFERAITPDMPALRLMVAQAGATAPQEQRFEFNDAPVLASSR